MATVISRLDFGDGVPRKLKCRHKYMREAERASGKSVFELLRAPFYGYPYLLQALLQPGSDKPITLDRASDLIDLYSDTHNELESLKTVLDGVLLGYLSVQLTPTADETDEAGNSPNADSPVAPGPSSA
jgi:hypothetical protein